MKKDKINSVFASKSREKFEIVAKTFRGLEDILISEVRSIGGYDIRKGTRVVIFSGNKETLYRANFNLRTALRILIPFYEYRAKNDHELYNGALRFDWSDVLSEERTFAIDGVLNSPWFNHSRYIALKVKDAIADQFMSASGRRPSVDTSDPDIRINLHISGDKVSLLLDSSGESLHKRGYRTDASPAPLNEVLAAGMVMLSGWDGRSDFIDPMCGSGTIPIEAAMMAYDIPPGIYRKQFAFEKWPGFDKGLLNDIYNYQQNDDQGLPLISGSDISPKIVALARSNAKNAFLGKKISFTISPFEDIRPSADNGVVLFNPPYGQRLKPENIRAFYTLIGDTLKRNFAGYSAWFLTSNLNALKYTGLRPDKKITLYNGPLECRFVRFGIYKGSRK